MIEAKELSKWFYEKKRGNFLAVDKVSFKCEAGEVYGLLGPNGAGKTTSLLMASSIMRPDSGEVFIAGKNAQADTTEARRNLGFMSTGSALFELLTPREVLSFVGRLYGFEKKELEARVAELIETLSMHDYADARCKGLSTGMKQKVSLARALIHDPPILILDEPTVGLDLITCQTLHDIIIDFRSRGKCIVYSTHIMSEAEKICDRIGIISGGRVLLEGTLAELQSQTGLDTLEQIFLETVRKPRQDV